MMKAKSGLQPYEGSRRGYAMEGLTAGQSTANVAGTAISTSATKMPKTHISACSPKKGG